METSFWQNKWKNNDIGFHLSHVNPLLVKHFDVLNLKEGSRVFLPLCGKTLDIPWLLASGYPVVGVELVESAVVQLFAELGVTPNITKVDDLTLYSARDIDIFVGDFFALSKNLLGQVDAVYDRAALIALPDPMRKRYAAKLTEITQQAPQLLITYEYDQQLMPGPPFSVSNVEVSEHYCDHYKLKIIASSGVEGGLKGKCAAQENVWLLTQ